MSPISAARAADLARDIEAILATISNEDGLSLLLALTTARIVNTAGTAREARQGAQGFARDLQGRVYESAWVRFGRHARPEPGSTEAKVCP